MTIAATRFRPALDDALQYFLVSCIPGTIVYYHVVAAVEEILADIKEFFRREESQALGRNLDDWIEFLGLSERRVALMHRVNGSPSPKARDNRCLCFLPAWPDSRETPVLMVLGMPLVLL
jgi:hypothetical protein